LIAGYALVSYGYRWLMLAGTFWFLYRVLEPRKLAAVWYTFVLASLGVLLAWPLVRLARAIYRQGRLPDMKRSRLWLSAAIVAAVVLVIGFVPLPVRVQGVGLLQVEPDQVQRVTVLEPGGFLKELHVQDGQHVQVGEVLAILANPELEIKLRVNEADQALRIQQKNALLAQPAEAIAAERAVAEGLQQTEFELTTLVQEHAALREQQARLTVRAPCSGTVLGLCVREDRGKWLEGGKELCRVGHAQFLRAVWLVPAENHELVEPGARAWVRVHGGGSSHWPGTVTEVSQVQASNIPTALASRTGGDVPTQQDPEARTDQPCQPHYLCVVRLQAVDPVLHAGALGRVRVEAAAETLWWRLRRFLATSFGGCTS
jgi:multidrug efflux pump subunit AcrA (membrane-fusion protein)